MPATTWEQETLELIHDAETDKQRAEQRVESARHAVATKEQEIAALLLALDHYRRKHSLETPRVQHSPVIEAEYAHLTPPQILDHWAAKHDGEIIVVDLVNVVRAAGVYRNYSQAAGTLYSAIRRRPDIEKAAPGHYRQSILAPNPLRSTAPGSMADGLAATPCHP